MGIASLILGIISLMAGWVPFLCFIMLILAVIGLILGIVDTVKKNKAGKQIKDTVISIVGLIICAIAIPVIVFSSICSMFIIATIINSEDTILNEKGNTNYDIYDYDYWHNKLDEQNNYNSISYEI